MFHKKSNQTFQTLSSIDTEGHKTSEKLSQIESAGGDKMLQKMKLLDESATALSPAE